MMYKRLSIVFAAALLLMIVAFLFLFVEYKKLGGNEGDPAISGTSDPELDKKDVLIQEYLENYSEPITNYDSENFIRLGEGDSGMLVKQKKYVYENNDVMILYVENRSGEDCSVILRGSFLDGDGKELAPMTKWFDGLSADDSNYFVFKPNITFEDFAYTLEVKPYSGTAYSEYIYTGNVVIDTHKRLIDGNGASISSQCYYDINAMYWFLNTYDEELAFSGDIVLFVTSWNI